MYLKTYHGPTRLEEFVLNSVFSTKTVNDKPSSLFKRCRENDARKVNETARKVGEKMGLPAGWDVVERMAGTDAARLLKKDWWGFHEISEWIFVGSCLGAPRRVLGPLGTDSRCLSEHSRMKRRDMPF